MPFTREKVVQQYKRLRLKLGRPPTSREFFKLVSRRACQEVFPKNTYSEIQSVAGDTARKFGQRGRSEDEFFEVYGKAIRDDIGHVPTEAEWHSKKLRPTVSGYRKGLGLRWAQVPRAFIDWAIGRQGWEEEIAVCSSYCKKNDRYRTEDGDSSTQRGYVYLMKANRKGQYKIGKTGSPGGRASQLSQLDPCDRKYEHVFETSDPVALESYWHHRFRKKKIAKEIFELTQDDVRIFKGFYAKKANR